MAPRRPLQVRRRRAATATCAARARRWSCSSRWRGALADGDRIYAVIRGSAVNNDGRSSGSHGHAEPRRPGGDAAHAPTRDAGVDPGAVGYVEAHGTGTRAGDPVELGALGAVLGEGRAPGAPCLVGSVKTNIGHTEGAAGVAGLIKAALALQHGAIPASLHFARAESRRARGPSCRCACRRAHERLAGRATARAWPGVSSLRHRRHQRARGARGGAAGADAAVVAAADAPGRCCRCRRAAPTALRALRRPLRRPARARPTRRSLADVCWQRRRPAAPPLERRAAFVADDAARAWSRRCARFAAGEAAPPQGVVDRGAAATVGVRLPRPGRAVGRHGARAAGAASRSSATRCERCDVARRGPGSTSRSRAAAGRARHARLAARPDRRHPAGAGRAGDRLRARCWRVAGASSPTRSSATAWARSAPPTSPARSTSTRRCASSAGAAR